MGSTGIAPIAVGLLILLTTKIWKGTSKMEKIGYICSVWESFQAERKNPGVDNEKAFKLAVAKVNKHVKRVYGYVHPEAVNLEVVVPIIAKLSVDRKWEKEVDINGYL